MSPDKIYVLKHLKSNSAASALDIAKKFCGAEREHYQKWYDRLVDMQTNGYVRFACNNRFPLCSVELTPSGEDVLVYEQKLLWSKRAEWIRYIVTTTIAVAAFVKSFFF